MKISNVDLINQYNRANKQWPFITELNDAMNFSPYLLYAVASRETNMCNVVGDGGHGHGVFQLDDRWHKIPPNFDNDVKAQANKCASMLIALNFIYNGWIKSLNAYNSGSPLTSHTAGGDYGPDVWNRRNALEICNKTQHKLEPPILHSVIPAMIYGDNNQDVKHLQTCLNHNFPSYTHIPVTGYYGDLTAEAVGEFQHRSGINDGDGRNVGPRTAAALLPFWG